MEGKDWEKPASDCWLLELVWKLLVEVEDLHLLMDPNDFLHLKSQLGIRTTSGSEAFCFRSSALLHVTSGSRDLKQMVPWILGVVVDPSDEPWVQEAAMRLFHSWRRGEDGRIGLLQALLAIEATVKRFFFAYRQLIVAVMGSLEASCNQALCLQSESLDSLLHMFLEPPYFPSLDAAKAFLGSFWVTFGADRGQGSPVGARSELDTIVGAASASTGEVAEGKKDVVEGDAWEKPVYQSDAAAIQAA